MTFKASLEALPVSNAPEASRPSALPLSTPKRRGATLGSRADWFPYYAGYSAAFVNDVLTKLCLPERAVVVDPWLGAGTTGEVALRRGYQFKGFDLNPAMLFAAKARLFANSDVEAIPVMLNRVLTKLASPAHICPSEEPLNQWFQDRTALELRLLEASIRENLVSKAAKPVWQQLHLVSFGASLFYIAYFRMLRRLLSPFRSSNPTWIKVPRRDARLAVRTADLLDMLVSELLDLAVKIALEEAEVPATTMHWASIRQASSTNIPLKAGSADAVISSPPYCTRIDYVRATLPELAAIGYPAGLPIKRLRDRMLGTPTVLRRHASVSSDWGPTATEFINAVKNHGSKASGTYYYTYYTQYLASTLASLRQLRKIARLGAPCVLVVQDSFYKNVHADLPQIVTELAGFCGWEFQERHDFHVPRTLAAINPETRGYRKTFSAVESALVFRAVNSHG